MQRRVWRSTEDDSLESPALDEQEQEEIVVQLEQADTRSSALIHASLSGICCILAIFFLVAPLPVSSLLRRTLLRAILTLALAATMLASLFAYIDLVEPRRYTWRHRDSPLQPVIRLLEDQRTLPVAVAVAFLAPLALEPSAFTSLSKALLLSPFAAILLTFYAHQEVGAVRKELTKLRGSKYGLRGV